MDSVILRCDSAAETTRIGEILGRACRTGDVVLLRGELATGKTTFTKGIVVGVGSADPVTSPTFMLAQFYNAGRCPVLHVDTYRLTSSAEFHDLALESYMDESVTVVEWCDLIKEDYPDHLLVEFAIPPDEPDVRTLSFSSDSARWAPFLAELDRATVGERG